MTVSAAPAFPDSRTLASWWRDLARYHPRTLWVAHLDLLRVEAPVNAAQAVRPERLSLLVLRAIGHGPALTVVDLHRQLHLDRPLLARVVHSLEDDALVCPSDAGGWSLSPVGRQALEGGQYSRTRPERRSFYFLRAEEPTTARFLPLAPGLASAWAAGRGWKFDPTVLDRCLRQSNDWKDRHGFPVDVQPAADVPEWQRVMVVYPERLVAAIATADGGRQLLGFAIPASGRLQAATPAFALGAGWPDAFPDLVEPSLHDWRQAWRDWCEAHDLPAAETEACHVERHDHRLRVVAPRTLTGRLRSRRGETWLLAGHGPRRAAALLDLTSASA